MTTPPMSGSGLSGPGGSRARRRSPTTLELGLAATAAGILALHVTRYWPFIADDALISLRYAKRLLQGLGLTWDSYHPVEGYSNLLWVLANAGAGTLGFDLVTGSRLLGALGMLAAIQACIAANRRGAGDGALSALYPALVLALSGSVAVWLIGGLEQPLVAALLAWSTLWIQQAVRDERPRVLGASLLLGLLVWTRPDSPVFVASLAAAFWWGRGLARRDALPTLLLVSVPLTAFLTQTVFRLWYYGELVPNTARVKLALSWTRIETGLQYVGEGFLFLSPLLLPLLFVAHPGVRQRLPWSRILAPSLALVAWIAYLSLIGGDIFPARRHFVPVVVLLALILGEVVAATREADRGLRRPAAGVAALALVLFAWGQLRDPQNIRAIDERWEWDGRTVGLFLKQAFGPQQPLLATVAAGSIPYWSELPSLDLMGLNDRQIARSRPPDFGQGLIGHELGDGAYVIDRKPDLVLEGLAFGPTTRLSSPSAIQMAARPEWRRHYVGIRFETDAPEAFRFYSYARIHSARIGMRRTLESLVAPGWLFASGAESVARFDPQGSLTIALSESTPAGRLRFRLSAGDWHLEIDAFEHGADRVELSLELPLGESRSVGNGDSFDVPNTGLVFASLLTESREPVYVKTVSLQRTPPSPAPTL